MSISSTRKKLINPCFQNENQNIFTALLSGMVSAFLMKHFLLAGMFGPPSRHQMETKEKKKKSRRRQKEVKKEKEEEKEEYISFFLAMGPSLHLRLIGSLHPSSVHHQQEFITLTTRLLTQLLTFFIFVYPLLLFFFVENVYFLWREKNHNFEKKTKKTNVLLMSIFTYSSNLKSTQIDTQLSSHQIPVK